MVGQAVSVLKRALPAPVWERFRARWWRYVRPLLVDYCPIALPWFPAVRHDDAIARMQRLAFRFHWQDCWSPTTSMARVVAAAVWPLRVALDSARELRQQGRAIRSATGLSLTRQYLTMLRLAFLENVPPSSFYLYRMFRPQNAGRARQYFCDGQMSVLYPRLMRNRPTDDPLRLKHLFFEHCRRWGLPTAEAVAVFADGALLRRYHSDVIPRCDLVLKPVGLAGGQGFQLWQYRSDDDGWQRDDQILDSESFEEHCRQTSRLHPHLLQVRLYNHPRLTVLSGSALATMRIITFRTPAGDYTTFLAGLRTPTGNASVDNWDAGGLIACVDLSTGICGPAIAKFASLGEFVRHPDTDEPLQGFLVPDFAEAVDVCLRAHDTVPWMPFVGWDVALTPDGPVLVEANPNWGIEFPQAGPDWPLGATCYPQLFLDHLATPVSSVPSPPVREASSRVLSDVAGT